MNLTQKCHKIWKPPKWWAFGKHYIETCITIRQRVLTIKLYIHMYLQGFSLLIVYFQWMQNISYNNLKITFLLMTTNNNKCILAKYRWTMNATPCFTIQIIIFILTVIYSRYTVHSIKDNSNIFFHIQNLNINYYKLIILHLHQKLYCWHKFIGCTTYNILYYIELLYKHKTFKVKVYIICIHVIRNTIRYQNQSAHWRNVMWIL